MREFRFDFDGNSSFIKKRTKGEAIAEFEDTFPNVNYSVTEIFPNPKEHQVLDKKAWKGNLDWTPGAGKKF